ncbi:hypothetical protein ACFPN7_23495 [Amycolatopsis halotolerans]|uniref:hypothetical protein n=1 Tax=Amycolatopsis halotolerans TaxID=330083 RepID=UPI00360E16FC
MSTEPRPGCSSVDNRAAPVSVDRLGRRLRKLGLRPSQTRSIALSQLATELPAALARMAGIHLGVAWQHVSTGDWARYTADVSPRPPSRGPRGRGS